MLRDPINFARYHYSYNDEDLFHFQLFDAQVRLVRFELMMFTAAGKMMYKTAMNKPRRNNTESCDKRNTCEGQGRMHDVE